MDLDLFMLVYAQFVVQLLAATTRAIAESADMVLAFIPAAVGTLSQPDAKAVPWNLLKVYPPSWGHPWTGPLATD